MHMTIRESRIAGRLSPRIGGESAAGARRVAASRGRRYRSKPPAASRDAGPRGPPLIGFRTAGARGRKAPAAEDLRSIVPSHARAGGARARRGRHGDRPHAEDSLRGAFLDDPSARQPPRRDPALQSISSVFLRLSVGTLTPRPATQCDRFFRKTEESTRQWRYIARI